MPGTTGLSSVQTAGQATGQVTRQPTVAVRKFKIVILLNALSLAFQIAGFVSPGWSVYSRPATSFSSAASASYGLWYVRHCKGDVCETSTLEELEFEWLLKSQRISTSMALFAIVVSTILATKSIRMQTAGFRHVLSACISQLCWCLVSGIVSLMTGGRVIDHYNESLKHGSADYHKFPYSALLTLFGGISAGMVSLQAVFWIFRLLKQLEREMSPPQVFTILSGAQPPHVNPAYQPMQTGSTVTASPPPYQQGLANGGVAQQGVPPAHQSGTANGGFAGQVAPSPFQSHTGNALSSQPK